MPRKERKIFLNYDQLETMVDCIGAKSLETARAANGLLLYASRTKQTCVEHEGIRGNYISVSMVKKAIPSMRWYNNRYSKLSKGMKLPTLLAILSSSGI